MNTKTTVILALGVLLFPVCLAHEPQAAEDLDEDLAAVPDVQDLKSEEIPEEPLPEKLEYAKGSVCGYCEYCSFCEQCKDCPCETSPSKPNCKMCKYCKYCKICDTICDTVCTPGGILDRFTGAIVNSLPTVDHNEVNQDIESVRSYINEKREEL